MDFGKSQLGESVSIETRKRTLNPTHGTLESAVVTVYLKRVDFRTNNAVILSDQLNAVILSLVTAAL